MLRRIASPLAGTRSLGATVVTRSFSCTVAQCEDSTKFYGRVAYAYGSGTDQPLSLTRMEYADDSANTFQKFSPFVIVPSWGPDGDAEIGTYADGGAKQCVGQKCVTAAWPAGWFPYERTSFVQPSWHGELARDKRDGSGLLYRRNRYYEPLTGRFTQEDPIGLAGGLNLYGFANGDPVNYSDPFGLCPSARIPAKDRLRPAEMRWALAASCLDVYRVAGISLGVQGTLRALFPHGNPGGGFINALRHATWSCQLTQEFGAEKATEITNAHEEDEPKDANGDPNRDSKADQHNNRVGRALSKTTSLSRSCLDAAIDAMAAANLDTHNEGP